MGASVETMTVVEAAGWCRRPEAEIEEAVASGDLASQRGLVRREDIEWWDRALRFAAIRDLSDDLIEIVA